MNDVEVYNPEIKCSFVSGRKCCHRETDKLLFGVFTQLFGIPNWFLTRD